MPWSAAAITVHSAALGDFTVGPKATNDAASIGEVDLVLLCVKTYDLEAAVHQLIPVIGASTTILTLQNGVDAAERVDAIAGAGHALTGVAFVNAALEGPQL
jgi:2-dehydropantoate 2-reductase